MAKAQEIDIEKYLQELAVTDWKKFKAVTALDLAQFSICQQKQRGKSIRQIAQKMKMAPSTVADRCKKCTQ